MSAGEHLELLSQQIQQGNRESLAELIQLASSPNKYQALAALRLGLLHDGTGPMGCLNDLHEALRYYRLSADLGNANAQFSLGNMYEFGEGVTQDWATARGWYELAANQGEINAQMNLARILQTGRGGLQDVEQAAIWYFEAAKQGDAQAATNLALMHMKEDISGSSIDLAIKLLEFSSTKLEGLACLVLGENYLQGIGVEQNHEQACMHFCLAEKLLPDGANLERTRCYLENFAAIDSNFLATFQEKASEYIQYVRGTPQ
jgi:TPR repeat protein